MKTFFLSSILLLLSGIPNEHEYYFSHTNITETEQSFQISCNIFIDDLEDMFKEEGIENLNLGLENESQITDSLLNDYLSKNLIFDLNNRVAAWEWIGKEVSEDLISFWIYLEIPKYVPTKTLNITNTILTQHIDGQKNLLNIKLLDNSKRFLLFQRDSGPKTIID